MSIDMQQILLHIMNLALLAFVILGIIWIARTIKKILFKATDQEKQDREYEEYLQWKREKDTANK